MYFLNFVGEFWNVKPEFQDWYIGRVEIFKEGEKWPIDELRFSTPPTKEWIDFRDKWDFKDIDNLEEFKQVLVKFQINIEDAK